MWRLLFQGNSETHSRECLLGSTRATHRKGKFETPDLVRYQAEISTISKARDLIHALSQNEVHPEQRANTEVHLSVLLDRLVIMGLSSVPRSLEIKLLCEWADTSALSDIESLKKYIRHRKMDLESLESIESHRLFMNAKNVGSG